MQLLGELLCRKYLSSNFVGAGTQMSWRGLRAHEEKGMAQTIPSVALSLAVPMALCA
jgi:hypothetical protein